LRESRLMHTARVRGDTQTVWAIDPAHSTVEFSMKNFLSFIVKGHFTEFAGSIVLDHADIGRSSVEVRPKTICQQSIANWNSQAKEVQTCTVF
jgi:polyisoprenoid-binding protein YceI